MCGINGILAYRPAAPPIDKAELIRSRDHMAVRGPDASGTWISSDGRVGLAHRRLAIIDLSAGGAQPMASASGKHIVTFNGEIYSHVASRRDLERKGHSFRSQSDTEVLLHLYEERGAAMVHELRGMFAFAIWDADRHCMFLARDPYGIKPLYYADDGRTFRFASQVKALIAGGSVSKELDPAGQVGFCLWGSVPEPFTIHSAIRALPAGSTLIVDENGVREPKRYHSIAKVFCDAEQQSQGEPALSPQEVQASMREALLDSVRHHLIADVPVGVFLSAGIDSSAMIGLMRDAGQSDIQSVTLAFAEFRGQPEDEAPLAEMVAQRYGARHTTRVISASDFEADLPRIMAAMDQPSIDGINTWLVSKAAQELGLKVAVSGLGGDELLGGYPSFREIPHWVGRFAIASHAPMLGRLARKGMISSGLKIFASRPKAAGMLEFGGTYPGAYLLRRGLFMPWELDDVVGADMARAGLQALETMASIASVLTPEPSTPFARVATLESSLYMRNQLLRDTDWASMAHSLEVRTPLVDAWLLKAVAPLLVGPHAALGKQALAAAPSLPLPQSVTGRRKTGFSVPVQSWMKGGNNLVKREAGLTSRDWSRVVLANQAAA